MIRMIWILSEDEDVEGNEDHEDVEARGHQVDSSRVPVQSLKKKNSKKTKSDKLKTNSRQTSPGLESKV